LGIFDLINIPLGYLFKGIYFVVGNYGWALVLFTVITKLILTPLSIKQQKSTMQMQKVQPKLAELQKKYQYDKEKLNQETLKLYQENNISPASGCLPLLIQFPVLIALYNIIRSPLTYVIQLGKHGLPTIEEVHSALTALGSTVAQADQIQIAAEMKKYETELLAQFPDLSFIDFNFFGLNLAQIPMANWQSLIIIIPILAGITTFLLSKITQQSAGNSQQTQDNPAAGSMQMMTYMFPIMTFVFSLSLPAGLGFYWIASNLYQMAQYVVLPKFVKMEESSVEKKEHYRERENRRKKK